MLSKDDENRHSCFVICVSREVSSFSLLSITLAVGFYRFSLSSWLKFCSIFSLLRVFLVNLLDIFSNIFSYIYWYNIFIEFDQLIGCILLIDFVILNKLYIPEINLILLQCIMLFIHYYIWFANIFLRIFKSVFIRCIGFLFACLVVSLSGFGIWVMVVSQYELECIVLLFFFFLEKTTDNCNFIDKCLLEFTSELIWVLYFLF